MKSLQEFIIAATQFIGNILVPFLFSIALLVFLYNVVRFFILGADQQPEREKAKQLALYGILGFVLLVSLWGIVNMFVQGFGLNNDTSLEPDYIKKYRQ